MKFIFGKIAIYFSEYFFGKYWAIFKSIGWLIPVARCFFPFSNFSRILWNIGLVDDCLTLLHRPCSRRWLQLYIISCCYSCHHQTLAETIFFPLISFLWCPTFAVTYEKCYRFSIFLVVLVYKLVFLLPIELWRNKSILPLACDFAWFWYTWRWVNLFNLRRNSIVWHICGKTTFKALV